MGKYVYIYYGGGDMPDRPPMEVIMKAWHDWFDELGDKLVDGGNPFNDGGKAVEASGVSTIENWPSSGYSIVNTDSMDEACELAKGCPALQAPQGAVRVYEALPM